MPTSIPTITSQLDSLELKYEVHERGFIQLSFGTHTYLNKNGDKGLLIVIELEEDGEFVKFFAPLAFNYKEGPHKAAVFETCMTISLMTKGVQFEYDQNDGEIRLMIEFPIVDNDLTIKQTNRCISLLMLVADSYYEVLQRAMKDGQIIDRTKEARAQAIAQLEAQLARLYARLEMEFGAENVFTDVDSVPVGSLSCLLWECLGNFHGQYCTGS